MHENAKAFTSFGLSIGTRNRLEYNKSVRTRLHGIKYNLTVFLRQAIPIP